MRGGREGGARSGGGELRPGGRTDSFGEHRRTAPGPSRSPYLLRVLYGPALGAAGMAGGAFVSATQGPGGGPMIVIPCRRAAAASVSRASGAGGPSRGAGRTRWGAGTPTSPTKSSNPAGWFRVRNRAPSDVTTNAC